MSASCAFFAFSATYSLWVVLRTLQSIPPSLPGHPDKPTLLFCDAGQGRGLLGTRRRSGCSRSWAQYAAARPCDTHSVRGGRGSCTGGRMNANDARCVVLRSIPLLLLLFMNPSSMRVYAKGLSCRNRSHLTRRRNASPKTPPLKRSVCLLFSAAGGGGGCCWFAGEMKRRSEKTAVQAARWGPNPPAPSAPDCIHGLLGCCRSSWVGVGGPGAPRAPFSRLMAPTARRVIGLPAAMFARLLRLYVYAGGGTGVPGRAKRRVHGGVF